MKFLSRRLKCKGSQQRLLIRWKQKGYLNLKAVRLLCPRYANFPKIWHHQLLKNLVNFLGNVLSFDRVRQLIVRVLFCFLCPCLWQIENEYGPLEYEVGQPGKAYTQWAAKMAVGLGTGVPWVMCKQDDAPDPIVSCHSLFCNIFSLLIDMLHNQFFMALMLCFCKFLSGVAFCWS